MSPDGKQSAEPKVLGHLSHKPECGNEEYENWVERDDFIRFLQAIPRAADKA